MPLQIKIPGADFSASSLPQFRELIYGLPVDNIHAVWPFDQGANGDVITTALDISGNGNHGVLVNGSANPSKVTGGVKASVFAFNMPGRGFMSTPFTFVMAGRKELTVAAYTQYPTFWRSLLDVIGGNISTPSTATSPILALNDELPSAGGAIRPGLFGTGTPITGGASSIRIDNYQQAGSLSDSYWCAAVSYDPATNTLIQSRETRGSTQATPLSPTWATDMEARNTTHIFGPSRWQIGANVENSPNGTLSLVAMYNVAMNAADLNNLRMDAKQSLITRRGLTIF